MPSLQLRGGPRPQVGGGLAYVGSVLQLQAQGVSADKCAPGLRTAPLLLGLKSAGNISGSAIYVLPGSMFDTTGMSDAQGWPAPVDGVLRNLRARNIAAVGAAASLRLRCRVNQAYPSNTLDVSWAGGTAADTERTDLTRTVAVLAGQRVNFEMREVNGSATGPNFVGSVEFYATG